MNKNRIKGKNILMGVLIMVGLLLLTISIASILTEKGIITEDMMTPIISLGIFIAALTGSIIVNKKDPNGKIIRAIITGLVLFGVPFLIGKTTSIEAIETRNALAILVFAEIGSLCGAVISNKKRRYKRV